MEDEWRRQGPARADRGRGDRRRPREREPHRARLQVATRVAVVTGASSGIGAELSRQLAAQGWHVVGLARRAERMLGLEHELTDVSDRSSVESAAARVLERHPRIDLLVLNAGIPGGRSFLEGDLELIERALRTNYLGSVWTLRAFLPGLERGAHVVTVVSVAGTVADGPYSATKHAQLAFSRSIAVELGRRGVSVHTVNPGLVETEGFQQRKRFKGLAGRLVADPPLVAERILDAIEHDRREIFVPRWYRPAAWVQALAPGLVARLRGKA